MFGSRVEPLQGEGPITDGDYGTHRATRAGVANTQGRCASDSMMSFLLSTLARSCRPNRNLYTWCSRASSWFQVSTCFHLSQSMKRTSIRAAVKLTRTPAHSLESKRCFTRVCLSAPLGWAWLQGNSRARRLRSAVPGLTGFGLPPRLPASPFADSSNNLLPDPPKNRLRLA
jgi:hypothetical protein